MSGVPEMVLRAEEYCRRQRLVLGKSLGFGVHGNVFAAENQTDGGSSALKVHERDKYYRRERNIYRRLQQHSVTRIRRATVPELLGYDDELLVIEMTVVVRPFVLDFAGAYLDFPPDYSEQVLDEWRTEKKEQFGSRWAEVQAIIGELEDYGVYMADVNPGNIAFDD